MHDGMVLILIRYLGIQRRSDVDACRFIQIAVSMHDYFVLKGYATVEMICVARSVFE